MSDFVGIVIKVLDNDVFPIYQTGLILKVLEAIGMEHCNLFPITTKVEAHIRTDDNGPKDKRDWSKL